MRKFRHFIDRQLETVNMYKGITFGLLTLLAVAEVFAVTGLITISSAGLALNVLVLGVSSFAANYVCSKLLRAPSNSESWLVSALIISCIIAPSTDPTRLGLAALAGVVAMASKYFIAWRGSLLLNPAAAGVFIVGLTGQLPAIWWIATPYMLIVTVPLALVTLYKHQKFTMFSLFFVSAFAVLLIINSMTQQDSFLTVLHYAVVSWPLIFLGSVMLTEPTTLPPQRYLQLMYALIVGLLTTSQLQFGPVETSPVLALLIGNVFVAFVLPPWGAKLRLVEHTKLSDDIHEFRFNKPKGMTYQAGQYLDWTLEHKKTDVKGNRRRFSLASAPSEKDVRIAIRADQTTLSTFKNAMLHMDVDDYIRGASIRGEFVLPRGNDKLLFIAGGIGITPFRSMVAELVQQKVQRDIMLVYISTKKDFIYADVFKQARKYGVQTVLTDSRLNAEELHKLVPDILKRQAYVSGPTAMVANYSDQLRDLGVKRRAIHTDNFAGY